jgi:hypothetical protein
MTTTVTTGEGQVCVFVAVDHCTSECIGIHASLSGNRFEALEPLRQGVREQFGGFSEPSPPSRNCSRLCGSSGGVTTSTGKSSATASARRARLGPTLQLQPTV